MRSGAARVVSFASEYRMRAGTRHSALRLVMERRSTGRRGVGRAPPGPRAQARSASSVASCSSPLVASALPCQGPTSPATELKRPPASSTIGTSAAMS